MKKTILIIFGLFALILLSVSAMGADGDIYYFTTTDITVDAGQFGIFITLALFIFLFYIGYYSDKRSGGAFLLLSGFLFFSFDFTLTSYVSAILVYPLITPISIFIILLGIRKFWYPMEGDNLKGEGSK